MADLLRLEEMIEQPHVPRQGLCSPPCVLAGFPVGSDVKESAVMQATQVRSLDQEDPLEKGMGAHSSILAWRVPCTEEPGGLQPMGSRRVEHSGATNTFTFHVFLQKPFSPQPQLKGNIKPA